jgi:dTMP kinase
MVGKFLVIEGCDGSGKTSQIKRLVEWLKEENIDFYLTDEPSEKGLRTLIKSVVSSETKIDDGPLNALLFTGDRRFHILTEVQPEMDKGKLVISDRYYHSTFAYQSSEGMDLDWLININKFSIKPDLTIIFDVPAEVSMERIMTDQRKQFDKYEKLEWLSKIRQSYLKLSEKLDEKIIIIDATRSKDEVFEDVKKAVFELVKA